MDVPPRSVELAVGRDRGEGGRGAGGLDDGLDDGHNHKITAFVRVSRKVRSVPALEGQGVDCGESQMGKLKKGEGNARMRARPRSQRDALADHDDALYDPASVDSSACFSTSCVASSDRSGG